MPTRVARSRRTLAGLALATLLLGTASPAGAGDAPSTKEVHAAIARGANFLRGTHSGGFEGRLWTDPVELVVLTLLKSGSNLSDEVFKAGVEVLETTPLRYTYRVSVLAMALSELNPRKYRDRLAHCAQWLVDTQLPGGEWGYPGSVQGRVHQPKAITVEPPPPPEEGAKYVLVERRTDPEAYAGQKGDFSNTQFAILGLRACRDSGIGVPKATWEAALAYNAETQRKDGGWGYVYAGEPDAASYASLTCAGLCGTAICLHALGKAASTHKTVRAARRWLEKNFRAERNVGIDRSAIMGPSSWQCYHLYSVERVGSVLRLKAIGDTKWYPAGARYLLGAQRADGSWADTFGSQFGAQRDYLTTADTCFAILFLAKATPPLTK